MLEERSALKLVVVQPLVIFKDFPNYAKLRYCLVPSIEISASNACRRLLLIDIRYVNHTVVFIYRDLLYPVQQLLQPVQQLLYPVHAYCIGNLWSDIPFT
jgi:hypothetical protein